MDRRNFLRCLGVGLAGIATGGQFCWPRKGAAAPGLRLACLADAHLQNGDSRRPEAQSLARAVAELRSLNPAPQLVLFGGDLADHGNPAALALGREILADLPAPCLMVMGEGDGSPGNSAPWRRLFGEPWFSRTFSELQILGMHTAWKPGPGEPVFRLGDASQGWLARELDRLNSEIPLLLLSHAPLAPVFRPWQQWTLDGPAILARLHRFRQVLCLHGHTHNAGASSQWAVVSKDDNFAGIFPENRKRKTENVLHLSLPATAWPQPQAIQGTPARLSPGLGPCGCGWALLTVEGASFALQPRVWSA